MSKRENQKSQSTYLGRLNLGEFHLIVVIISTTIGTDIDVSPPVLVVGVAGEREDAGLERAEDGAGGVGEGGCPAGDEEEEEGVEGPDDDQGVRRPPPRRERGRVVVPSCSGGSRITENAPPGGRRASGLEADAPRSAPACTSRVNAYQVSVRNGASATPLPGTALTVPDRGVGACLLPPAPQLLLPRTRTEIESTTEGTAVTCSIFWALAFPGA